MFDCDFIQAAHSRLAVMRASAAHPVEPPTQSELEHALGEPVQNLRLWAQNWRNRVYRIELAGSRAAIAKQAVRGTEAMVRHQYEQLELLLKLEIPSMRVPKALALLPDKRVYVMEFAPGRTIESLVRNSHSKVDLLPACRLAAEILAQMHIVRTAKTELLPVEPLARDFDSAPWRLTSAERKILESTLDVLARAELRMGEIYYDYKPANLLFQNGELFLVDPPDVVRQGAQLRDFVAFQSSMRRHLWRLTWRRPFAERRAHIREGMTVFKDTYLARVGSGYPAHELFAATVRLFELQRTAILMTMQTGKVELAQGQAHTARKPQLGSRVANRMTRPLFEIEKRWLFRRLEQELP